MTTYVDIPIIDYPLYEMSVSLEGNSYILEFTYVERMKLYTISMYDSDKNPLVLGEALIPNYPIFQDYALADLSGAFYLIDKSALQSEAYKLYPENLSQYYYLVYAY